MNEETLKKIETYKTNLRTALNKYNQFKGAKEEQLKRLKDEFGLKSLAEAEKYIEKTNKTLDDLEEKLQNQIEAFEDKYMEERR